MKQDNNKKEQPAAQELDALKKKADERDEYCDKYLRLLAEYDNAKKRLAKEREGHIKFANEDLMLQLFPIVDNFDMALSAVEKAPDKAAVMDGIRLVQKEFHRILEENGVKKIKVELGGKFDPAKHEALETVEGDAAKEGTIVEEMQPGYELNGLVIRPAKVKVIKGNQKPEQGNQK